MNQPSKRAATLVGLGEPGARLSSPPRVAGAACHSTLRPSPPENQLKGLVIQTVLRYAALHGGTTFQEALGELDSELADLIRHGGLTAGGFYPIAHVRHALGALRTSTGSGPEVARRVGFMGLRADLSITGPFRHVGQQASVQALASRAPWLFSRYVDHGDVQVVPLENGRTCVRFSHCYGFDAALWEYVRGACAGALAAVGETDCSILPGRAWGEHPHTCQLTVTGMR